MNIENNDVSNLSTNDALSLSIDDVCELDYPVGLHNSQMQETVGGPICLVDYVIAFVGDRLG